VREGGKSLVEALALQAARTRITEEGRKIHFMKGCSGAGHAYSLSKRGVQRMVERQAMAFGLMAVR
jgi:hypothetical protein